MFRSVEQYFATGEFDEDLFLRELFRSKFEKTPYCLKCRKPKFYHRATRSKAFVSQCCGIYIYPMAGTIFEKTSLPLEIWFSAFKIYIHRRADINLKQLRIWLKVSKHATFRIRRIMKTNSEEIRKYCPQFPTQEENDKWQEEALKAFYKRQGELFASRVKKG